MEGTRRYSFQPPKNAGRAAHAVHFLSALYIESLLGQPVAPLHPFRVPEVPTVDQTLTDQAMDPVISDRQVAAQSQRDIPAGRQRHLPKPIQYPLVRHPLPVPGARCRLRRLLRLQTQSQHRIGMLEIDNGFHRASLERLGSWQTTNPLEILMPASWQVRTPSQPTQRRIPEQQSNTSHDAGHTRLFTSDRAAEHAATA